MTDLPLPDNTPATPFVPADEFIIDDLETLKVMADPLRLHIVEQLSDDPCTVKQLASDMDLAPSKLYYHINLLEKHGLLRVVQTRLVSGILEKTYQTAARVIRVKRGLLSPGGAPPPDVPATAATAQQSDDARLLLLDAVFDETKREVQQSARASVLRFDAEPPLNNLDFARVSSLLTPDEARRFHDKLVALVREFSKDDQPDASPPSDGQMFALVYTFYPTTRRVKTRPSDLPPAEN